MKSCKLTFFLLLQLAMISATFCQNVAINATGNMPDSSAILDVSSTSKGFLLPRMTTAQQNAIVLPATGLAIFNTTLNSFQVNTGTPLSPAWSSLTTTTSTSAWSVGGNNVTSLQNIGTKNNFDFPFITNNTEKMRLSAGGNLGIGNAVSDGDNAEKLLADAGTNSYNVISGKGNLNNFLQLNIKNINPGNAASSDIVATNDAGTELNGLNYVNMGINSSSNNSIGILGGANTGYLYSTGSDFSIGNATVNKNLLLFTGGTAAANERMRIDSSGNVGIGNPAPAQKLDVSGNIKFSGALMPGNSAGTAGNFLKSAGSASAPVWTTIDTSNIAGFSQKVRPLLSATAPITYSSASGAIGVNQASATQNGFLSSNDWNMFNNKQSMPTYSGTVVESFGKTDNYGITSSVTNPTTNPVHSVGVDTLSISTRKWRQKGIDSVQANINAATAGISGKQPQLNGTGFVKATGTSITYDNSTFLTANQAITLSGDVSGTGTSGITASLKTVNSNVGTFNNITINAKGLATAGSNVTFSATAPVAYSNGLISMPVANTSTNGYLSSGDWNTFNTKGNGMVTSASVVTANGLAGSVTNGATPAITLTTTINGLVEGNGTAFSAATPGTDYAPGTASNATGIVKSTTTTGALTTAIAADFPLLNQNTTGTASNITGILNAASLPALTGDVTKPAGSAVTTISDDAVTNAKLANMVTQTFKGKTTAGTGSPEDITGTQATAMLNTFNTLKGLVPASSGGTANFLRADGTFAIPPGTSTATGTVTTISIASANGVSGSVTTPTTTPAITLNLGAIKPSSIVATGTVAGSNLTGTNTGDETTSTIKTKLGAASATTDGYLTLADWNAFNSAANNSIITTTTDLTLNATHKTVIVTGLTPKITLPPAADFTKRIFIIVNETGNNVNLNGLYVGFNKGYSTIVSGTSAITIQSDGKDWYRIQ